MTSKKNKIKKYFSRTTGFISPYIFTPPPFAVPPDIGPTGTQRALFWCNVTNPVERMDKIQLNPVQPVIQFNFKFILNFENCVFRNSGDLLYFLQ